ncbi:hypothetical protein [Gracilibacillus salinarum]|nr:hypothetical protein [Gracilibacillus salinarum]
MNMNKVTMFLQAKKKAIVTLAVIIAAAWILGQISVPALLKIIFL